MYNKEISLTGYNNGYRCFWDKEHPLSTTDGRVFYHRHIASIKIGRWLTSEEHVHHIDGNILNNELSNLQILSRSEHTRLHKTGNLEELLDRCQFCDKIFVPKGKVGKYCSVECNSKSQIKELNLTKELLDELIPKHSWVVLASMFGYSDTGIKKRAKSLGCIIPIRKKHISSMNRTMVYGTISMGLIPICATN